MGSMERITVVASKDFFDKTIDTYIVDGWKPIGGVAIAIDGGLYGQAMVKEEKDEINR